MRRLVYLVALVAVVEATSVVVPTGGLRDFEDDNGVLDDRARWREEERLYPTPGASAQPQPSWLQIANAELRQARSSAYGTSWVESQMSSILHTMQPPGATFDTIVNVSARILWPIAPPVILYAAVAYGPAHEHAGSYWAKPAIGACIVNLLYLIVTFFGPTMWYLRWAQHHDATLPDIMLDNSDNFPRMAPLADAVPVFCFAGGLLTCFWRDDIFSWSLMLNANVLMMICKGILEVVTTIPSSYGYERCCAYLHINGVEELEAMQVFSISSLWRVKWGGCASMLWSGHTVQTMLGCYGCSTPLQRTKGELHRGQVWIMLAGSCVVGPLLLSCRAHYTVDVLLAIMVCTTVLTHSALRSMLTYAYIPAPGEKGRQFSISSLPPIPEENEAGLFGDDLPTHDPEQEPEN